MWQIFEKIVLIRLFKCILNAKIKTYIFQINSALIQLLKYCFYSFIFIILTFLFFFSRIAIHSGCCNHLGYYYFIYCCSEKFCASEEPCSEVSAFLEEHLELKIASRATTKFLKPNYVCDIYSLQNLYILRCIILENISRRWLVRFINLWSLQVVSPEFLGKVINCDLSQSWGIIVDFISLVSHFTLSSEILIVFNFGDLLSLILFNSIFTFSLKMPRLVSPSV